MYATYGDKTIQYITLQTDSATETICNLYNFGFYTNTNTLSGVSSKNEYLFNFKMVSDNFTADTIPFNYRYGEGWFAPAGQTKPRDGQIIYDTFGGLNKLKYYDANAEIWKEIAIV